MNKDYDAYCVMWVEALEPDLTVYTLAYRGGAGGVRTYLEGHLDPRAGDEENMPRFQSTGDAMEFMLHHLGEHCLVSVAAAKYIRKPADEFADPV